MIIMSEVFSQINKIDPLAWSDLAEASSTATWFQTREAYEFYESLPGLFEPFVFAVEGAGGDAGAGDGEAKVLKGVCVGYVTVDKNPVKQFLTRRAIVVGGPMVADDITDEELTELLRAVRSGLKGRAIYVETRNFNDYSRWRDVFERNGFEYVRHLNFHIDTSSEEVIAANLGKSRKRDIRTSLRDGAEIMETVTLEDVRSLYEILNTLYRTKVKTPLFPFSFFEKLFTSGIGIFRLVRFEGRVVGGTVCVGLPGRALYEWFACGEDGVIKNVFPSTMATFAGMEFAARNGYPRFDMMGAGKPDEGYGVRDFKAKFGGVLVEHGRFQYICKPLLYKLGELGVKILKKIK